MHLVPYWWLKLHLFSVIISDNPENIKTKGFETLCKSKLNSPTLATIPTAFQQTRDPKTCG